MSMGVDRGKEAEGNIGGIRMSGGPSLSMEAIILIRRESERMDGSGGG